MKIRAVSDKVVIEAVEPETKTAGGIYIPDEAQEKTLQGWVVAVDDENEGGLSVGDYIHIEKFSSVLFKVDGTEYTCVQMKNVLAVDEEKSR